MHMNTQKNVLVDFGVTSVKYRILKNIKLFFLEEFKIISCEIYKRKIENKRAQLFNKIKNKQDGYINIPSFAC